MAVHLDSRLSVALTPLAGTLCFSEGRECIPTSGTTIEVAELDNDRLYVWTSEDWRSVVIGELLYVIPREGSFAPVRVTASSSSAERPIRVEVPPPAGSLRLAVKDSEGNDVARFIVMMRYNGEWIPYPVIFQIRGSRTPEGIEYFGMPAGAFELWAITPSVPVVPNAPPPHPPVRVGLGAGGAKAELTVVGVP